MRRADHFRAPPFTGMLSWMLPSGRTYFAAIEEVVWVSPAQPGAGAVHDEVISACGATQGPVSITYCAHFRPVLSCSLALTCNVLSCYVQLVAS
jgi:hypothetical protein